MGESLTLIARLDQARTGEIALPVGLAVRACRRSDTPALGRLYYEAYEPGVACDTLDEATADIRASFAGAYGELWPAASMLVHRGGEPVAALLTVRRAPWAATPDCPFIIELFTAPGFRRRGLAHALLARCFAVARRAGESAVALRVDEGNAAARALYASLGFGTWQPAGEQPAPP